MLECLKKHDLTMEESRQGCNCQEACELLSYDVTHSSSEWPAQELWEAGAHELGIFSENYANNSIKKMMVKRHIMGQLARVNIFFETNQRTIIEQNAKFESFWSFFITWSGAMSIYLGISAKTLVGLIFLLCQNVVQYLEMSLFSANKNRRGQRDCTVIVYR